MSRPRLEVSAIQVVATVLAAVTGALLASYLGVVGTITGTAVASGASTMATAIYRHYLGRTKERFQEVAPVIAKRTRLPEGPLTHGAAPATRQPMPSPATNAGVPTFTAARVPTFTPHGDQAAGQTRPTRVDAPATASDAGRVRPTSVDGIGGLVPRWRRLWNRRLLVRYWIPAFAAFVVVIGGITGFELAVGKPVSSVVWGKSGGGTSVGNAFSGSSDGSSSPAPAGHKTSATEQPSSGAPSATVHASSPTSASPTPASSASSGAAATPSASPTGTSNGGKSTGSNGG
jgi:hypothetical protein